MRGVPGVLLQWMFMQELRRSAATGEPLRWPPNIIEPSEDSEFQLRNFQTRTQLMLAFPDLDDERWTMRLAGGLDGAALDQLRNL